MTATAIYTPRWKETSFLSKETIQQDAENMHWPANLMIEIPRQNHYPIMRLHNDMVSSIDTKEVAWENSRHFARSPLEPLQNDVWVTSAEIPYWWRVTTQI